MIDRDRRWDFDLVQDGDGGEWIDLEVDGRRERIGFFDYDRIYTRPGLYEQVFYEVLGCSSHRALADALGRAMAARPGLPGGVALDVGAGNGVLGRELRDLGWSRVVGLDTLRSAAAAADRDRPGVYERYHVGDLDHPDAVAPILSDTDGFSCVASIAALGSGHVGPDGVRRAIGLVEPGGLLALTLRADFWQGDVDGFGEVFADCADRGVLRRIAAEAFVHRRTAAGDPIRYVAVVMEKR